LRVVPATNSGKQRDNQSRRHVVQGSLIVFVSRANDVELVFIYLRRLSYAPRLVHPLAFAKT
jgi:hypothetical protein